jgi:hypothetical protein
VFVCEWLWGIVHRWRGITYILTYTHIHTQLQTQDLAVAGTSDLNDVNVAKVCIFVWVVVAIFYIGGQGSHIY